MISPGAVSIDTEFIIGRSSSAAAKLITLEIPLLNSSAVVRISSRISVFFFLRNPNFLVLDEPTTGLDYRECVKVMDIIRRIHERGTTVVMVCHDMEVVADYAARCIVMSGGEVVDDAPTFDVLRNRETLERASLVPPQIVELSLELGREMPHLADGPVGRANTLDEMAAAVMEEVRTSERSVCA